MNRLICAVMATAVCAAVSAGANREFTITSCRFAPELQNDQGVNDLVECGIDSVKKFKAVLHTTQSIACSRRRKKLDEQRDGTKKTPLPPPKKNGRMLGVKRWKG